MLDLLLHRQQAGRSAERQYKRFARAWRHRMFGRRFDLYFWTVYALLVILAANRHPGSRISLFIGFGFGAAAATWLLLPEAVMPAQILNWQRGAWGEQNTESELKKLERAGWTVRHDVRWGDHANHDHIVAGRAVYVLNSKNVKESIVALDDDGIRVTQLETHTSYVVTSWGRSAEKEARSIRGQLQQALGFPVYVNPVVVIWGQFELGQTYIGNVCFVRGDKLAEWLASRPADILQADKRQAVADAIRALPSA